MSKEIHFLNDYSYDQILEAKNCEKGWDRICFHDSRASKQHVMIMHMKESVTSGFHYRKSNELICYSLRKGRLEIDIIENVGKMEEVITFNLLRQGDTLLIPEIFARNVKTNTNISATYLEIRLGPYDDTNSTMWL